MLLHDPKTPVPVIWDRFLNGTYGLSEHSEGRDTIRRILEDTFTVSLKSAYMLGLPAGDVTGDLPDGAVTGTTNPGDAAGSFLSNRVRRDPAWKPVVAALAQPDRSTVLRVWQEASEAVEIAAADLDALEELRDRLDPAAYADIHRRILHQRYAAEAWRAVKLFVVTRRAFDLDPSDPDYPRWLRWAHETLTADAAAMRESGLDDVPVVSPSRIDAFVSRTAGFIPGDATGLMPEVMAIFPLSIGAVGADFAEGSFHTSLGGHAYAAYGLSPLTLYATVDLGTVASNMPVHFIVRGLAPGGRTLVRVRLIDEKGVEHIGGDWWVFTLKP